MEQKKKITISLSTFFLIIAIIIILVMGFYLYRVNNKIANITLNESTVKGNIDENKNTALSENNSVTADANITDEDSTSSLTTEISQKSFSEVMDILYTKQNTIINGDTYSVIPSDFIYYRTISAEDGTETIEYADVTAYNNWDDTLESNISFNMKKANSEEVNTSITGISEEIVSIKILEEEATGMPSLICFLSRTGNVYYLNNEMINANNFTAKQVSNLNEVVSLEVSDVQYVNSMHGSTTILATTFSGEKIDVVEAIFQ